MLYLSTNTFLHNFKTNNYNFELYLMKLERTNFSVLIIFQILIATFKGLKFKTYIYSYLKNTSTNNYEII